MPQYQSRGKLPQKRYTKFQNPKGGIYYEHILTAEGFNGAAALQYHLRSPTRINRITTEPKAPIAVWDESLTQNLLFHVSRIPRGGDFLAARVPSIVSDDFIFAIAKPDRPMQGFYRNGFADEVVLIVEGSGVFESAFGNIRYSDLDLLYIPRGDTMRWVPDAGVAQSYVVIESRSPIQVPPVFVKPNGQFRENASYHERDIRAPELADPIDAEGEFPIRVKMGERMETTVLDHHPFDVVGWDGYLYPFALNLRDYEPLAGRIALLPDMFQVFVTERTMITCITPRRLADHPEASNLQPFHQNMDFDEILYRFVGSTGQTEPEPGTFTLHPRSVGHGPKPGFENLPKRTYQEAWGFMIDTRAQLRPSLEAMKASDDEYAKAWLTDQLSKGRGK